MSFDTTFTTLPEYLRVDVSGEFSIPNLFGLIETVMREAVAAERKLVLVDARNISGELNEADRFLGGQRSAEVFGSRIKSALLMPADKITKMAELAAGNRGAKLLVTADEDEAVKWLMEN